MKPEAIARIRKLEAADGTITAQAVVDDARDPSSPLHDHFEWDDDKAAHAFRINQARELIRSVRLVITNRESVVRTVAYVRDPNKAAHDGGYVSTFRLRKSPDDARAALMAELARADSAMDRAMEVARSLGLEKQVGEVIAALEATRQAANGR